MSTVIQGSSFLRGSAEYDDQPTRRFTFRTTAESFGEAEGPAIRYSSVSRISSNTEHKQQPRVLRRMSGFLVEMRGKNARVAFVEKDQTFQYDMPSDQLRKCGVEIANQPFQMDEIEMQTADGLVVGYRFRPLAKTSDAYIETLSFDADRKRKRDLILSKFAKAKA